MHWRRKWHPTPVSLPGESHGRRSLAGYYPWGHKESNMTERLNLRVYLLLCFIFIFTFLRAAFISEMLFSVIYHTFLSVSRGLTGLTLEVSLPPLPEQADSLLGGRLGFSRKCLLAWILLKPHCLPLLSTDMLSTQGLYHPPAQNLPVAPITFRLQSYFLTWPPRPPRPPRPTLAAGLVILSPGFRSAFR